MGYSLEIIGNVKRLKKVAQFPEDAKFEIALVKESHYNREENIFTQKQKTELRVDGREIKKGDAVRVIFERNPDNKLCDIVGHISEICVLNGKASIINGALVFRDENDPEKKINVLFNRIKYITYIGIGG